MSKIEKFALYFAGGFERKPFERSISVARILAFGFPDFYAEGTFKPNLR
jgi:hypothetical protein